MSLYSSGMSHEKSMYPETETGYAFTPDMNNDLVEKFIDETFTQGSAILIIKCYNPKNLIVQHINVKEKVIKIEINRMRNGYIIDALTNVDIQEIVEIGGKVNEVYEGVIYREIIKVSPFKKVIDKSFELRQEFKDENNDVMQLLVNLISNSFYGEQTRKGIEDSYHRKSEHWMLTEYDERVLDYQKTNHGYYIVKKKNDEGLQDEVKKVNTMPLQLSAFVLSNSKRIVNNFVHAIDGFFTDDLYYEYTDSVYIGNKQWAKLDKASLIGKNRLQGKHV